MFRKNQLKMIAQQKLQDYIQSNHLSGDIISDLVRLVLHIPHKTFKNHITSHLSIMQSIKWLILLHNLIFSQIKNNQTQIESLIQLVNPTQISAESFESILFQKMIKPYKAYLLKRNAFNLREIEPQFHCFALINMLKAGLSFTNIIFTLGRYLFKNYNFLVQFNIIMAKDLSYLYKLLKYKMSQDFQAQNFRIIELINQSMYSVFYNCYFNKVFSHIAPDWIEIDTYYAKREKQLAKKSKIFNKSQVITNKEIKSCGVNSVNEQQVSIVVDQSSLKVKDQVKSISTIASHRQTRQSDIFEDVEPSKRQKDYRQRKEFIQMAESILQSFKNNQVQAH